MYISEFVCGVIAGVLLCISGLIALGIWTSSKK